MPELLAVAALTLMFSLFLGLLRVMRGPGPGDRMLAAQLIGTSGVGMLLLLGVLLGVGVDAGHETAVDLQPVHLQRREVA